MIRTMTEKPKQKRHSTSATKPREVSELWENLTELQEISSYTTQSGGRVIKPSRHGK